MVVGQAVQKSEYRKDIDGLRALAVICVIINHLSHEAMPGGYLGVDIFFVISGYVITTSLERASHTSLGSQLLRFYSRRIKRLMPALLTMILVASAAIRLFDSNPQISSLTGIASAFGCSNIFLFWQATNYFGVGAQRNMFAHTWSLGVEEQFYLLYPFLFRWRRPSSPDTLWSDRFRLGALTLLSIASFLLFLITYRNNQPAAYFLMPCRFWELGLGCMLGLAAKVYEQRGVDRPIRMPGWLALLAMVPGFILGGRYPVFSTVLVVLATAALIGCLKKETGLYRMLASRPFTYVGSISYSLYLWHWPVICISFWTIGIHTWSLPFQVALMLILSMASYHLIENPLRRATWFGGNAGTIATGLTAMIVAAGIVMIGQSHKIPKFTGAVVVEGTSADSPVPGYISLYSHRKIDPCFANIVFGANADPDKNLRRCSAGSNTDLRLIFVGDSHAMDLVPMADQIYKDGVASVTNVFQPGCRVPPLDHTHPECAFADLLTKKLASDGDKTNVLVLRENYSPRRVNGDLGEFAQTLEALVDRTTAAGMKVIYIAPAPKYDSVDSLCVPQWFRPSWAMGIQCRNGFLEDRGEQMARRSDVTDYLFDLSKKRAGFFVFDPFDTLCGSSAKTCTPLRDGQLIYRDDSHLTEKGSVLLARPFEDFLREHRLLPPPLASR